jgi:hypothetical protein
MRKKSLKRKSRIKLNTLSKDSVSLVCLNYLASTFDEFEVSKLTIISCFTIFRKETLRSSQT